MDQTFAKLLDAQQAQEVLRHAEKVRVQAAGEAVAAWGVFAWNALFALGALLLLAWVFWPRRYRQGHGRAGAGFAGGVLLAVLCAAGTQTGIDRNRGFIADRQRRMDAELRAAMDQARKEHLAKHPDAAAQTPAELEKELLKAENAARENLVRSHYLYIPQGNALRYLTLNNPALAADYLWLTSLQYVTSPFRQGQKFDMLHRFYDEMLNLDPGWVEIYVNAGKVLSALDPERHRTELFLCRAITRNPRDHQLPMEAGRLYVVPTVNLRQSQEYSRKAGEFFEQALARRELPKNERVALEDLIARLKREAGLYGAAAERLWKIVTDPEAPKPLRESASREWLQAESLVRADLFQQLANAYRARHRAPPPSLGEALRDFFLRPEAKAPEWLKEGLSGRPPLDAYGLPIDYDPLTGAAASRGVRALHALRKGRMIDTLIATVYSHPQRAVPLHLRELKQYVARYFATPQGPPYAVVEILGENLDTLENPLGGEFEYNPQTGTVVLPPICNPRELLRNADPALDGQAPPYFK